MPNYGATTRSPLGSPNKAAARAEAADVEVEVQAEESVYELYEPLADVSWRYISRLYMLVPVVTLLFFIGLDLLVTFAWPPSSKERRHGQQYPHPILPWPFLTGLFAACTVQTLRVPIWVAVSWLPLGPRLTGALATTLHSGLHELVRLATLPMIAPSPTSGFHSSYYLGLGWGIAEAVWGIIQGWEQLSLYEDVLKHESGEAEAGEGLGLIMHEEGEAGDGYVSDYERQDELEEAELERKVEALENMRERRDLEEVLGTPFPNIPIALHLLWRIDTLLLNLGLTLILSAYYFNSYPIYQPDHLTSTSENNIAHRPNQPSRWLWLVWAVVAFLHICVSLVWKVVGRVGIGAVTWGGLIVSLGSVFAGLGGWGGLV